MYKIYTKKSFKYDQQTHNYMTEIEEYFIPVSWVTLGIFTVSDS
jgi:hypothetical protein